MVGLWGQGENNLGLGPSSHGFVLEIFYPNCRTIRERDKINELKTNLLYMVARREE